MPISLNCKHCKKEFQVIPSRAKSAICCSRACLWHITKHIREPKRLEKCKNQIPHNYQGVHLECIQCKKEFPVSPSRISYAKFCSKKCYTIATKKPSSKRYKRITINGIRMLEHRYIMEQFIGRKLEAFEHVHHINHNTLDNRIENLEVLSIEDHAKKHSLPPFPLAKVVKK